MANKKSSQATASAFGWIFQTAAGLYLLLDCIEKATDIEMEGKKEDIEITLDDHRVIYAQAKSTIDINDTKNNRKKLKSALTSLSDCTKPVAKLIYVTNILNPLNSDTQQHYIYSRTPYSSFLDADKATITQILSEIDNGSNFQTSKFELVSFKFTGEDDIQLYSAVLEKVKEFISKTLVSESKAVSVLNEWKCLLMDNNAQHCKLSKSDIVFPLILVTIENQDVEKRYNEVCNLGIYDETIGKYGEFVRKIPHKTEFFIKVCGHYQKQFPQGGDNINSFVEDEVNWREYIAEFAEIEKDEEMLESLIKILLLETLLKRKAIGSIKEATKLTVQYDN